MRRHRGLISRPASLDRYPFSCCSWLECRWLPCRLYALLFHHLGLAWSLVMASNRIRYPFPCQAKSHPMPSFTMQNESDLDTRLQMSMK